MSIYIELVKAVESVCNYCQVKGNCQGECVEVADLKAITAADVQEVKHGKWIEETERIKSIAITPTFVKYYRCSECGRKEHHKEPYCNCGARMDGEE